MMSRFISVALVLTGLLLTAIMAAPGVVAQDDSTSMAGHPMVGTWFITDPTGAEPPELFVATADGIAISGSVEGTGFGSWAATGDRTADATIRFPWLDPEAGFLGIATMRASVEVAEDGQSFAGTYTAELPAALAEAMGVPVGELGPGDVSGVRVVVEPMGEPVAPMPEMAEEAPAE